MIVPGSSYFQFCCCDVVGTVLMFSIALRWVQQQDSEGDDMELDEFALGDSAIGSARGEDGGSGAKGLKAAASTAASNLRRNVRSMLTAQQQQRQQQDNRSAWAATGSSNSSNGGSSSGPAATAVAAAGLSPLCATASPSSGSGGPTPSTLGGGGSIGDLTSTAAPSTDTLAFPLPNAFRAASAASGGGDTGASSSVGGSGRNWVSQLRTAAGVGDGTTAASAARGGGGSGVATGAAWTKSPPSPVPALGEFPPLPGVAAAPPAVVSGVGSRGMVAAVAAGRVGGAFGCGGAAAAAAGGTGARVTAPSTPLPGTAPPVSELLKEGDSVEAQFLLPDQAVWTTSWYRGEVSTVNPAGGEGGAGVTYGVSFADGDRLDTVPELHIRLFRGLRVGSVVSVEWPSKGGRPFKGCLTKVCHGEGDSSPTVSVIFEDADTEVCVCVYVCVCMCVCLRAWCAVFDFTFGPWTNTSAGLWTDLCTFFPCLSFFVRCPLLDTHDAALCYVLLEVKISLALHVLVQHQRFWTSLACLFA